MRILLFSAQSHRHTQMQIFPIDHCPQRRISHSQFARNTEIPVSSQGLFHLSLLHLNVARLTRANHVLQQLFVLLQQSTAAVIAQYAKEHVLVVCEMRHTLDDIDVSMLWTTDYYELTRSLLGKSKILSFVDPSL